MKKPISTEETMLFQVGLFILSSSFLKTITDSPAMARLLVS
jgi:hypothetical protein